MTHAEPSSDFARPSFAQRAAAAVALPLALACAACAPDPGPGDPEPATEARYVGMDECRHCHLQIATTYTRTGMGRAWYPMSPAVAVEDFRENNEIEIPSTGLRYRMEERDGRYFMKQFRRDSRGREIALDERELQWVVGSGHHSRSYATVLDGRLFQAPVCWYPDASLWDLCPGFDHESKHFTRGLSESCVFCHNGRMVPVAGTMFAYDEPIPHGIGCERCHGPGSLHVEKWQAGEALATGEPDSTIVNPRRLPPETRIHVCFQCHLGDSKATNRVSHRERSLLDFRPGQFVTEAFAPFRYQEEVEHDFGISAQADRLILSRCYTESAGRLECLTCHNPHVTVYHPDRPVDLFRRKCLGCHDVEGCAGDAAARAATEGLSDDCVACHMRVAEPDDQRHTTVTDHWIRRSIETDPQKHRRSLEIEPVFPDLHAAYPPADQAFYRGRAELMLSTRTPDPRRRGMWENAERAFHEAIAGGLDDERSWYHLGQAQAYLRRPEDAERSYRVALERNRDSYDAAYAVGQALAARGELEQAIRVFRDLASARPEDSRSRAELARLVTLAGRVEEGVNLYTEAIEREPWTAQFYSARGGGLAVLGRMEEAEADARSAVRLDPDDPNAWQFLSRVMEARGLADEAEEAHRVLERLGVRRELASARP